MFQEWAVAAGIPRKPLYRASEVARVLGISRSTIYDEVSSGRLKAKRPTRSGYCVYIMGEAVDEWLKGAEENGE